VKTIDFDINFLNFEDPEVFDRMTGPDYEKNMKATYGMDYIVREEPGDLSSGKYLEHCVNSESR
jgi:hypothetical protein